MARWTPFVILDLPPPVEFACACGRETLVIRDDGNDLTCPNCDRQYTLYAAQVRVFEPDA